MQHVQYRQRKAEASMHSGRAVTERARWEGEFGESGIADRARSEFDSLDLRKVKAAWGSARGACKILINRLDVALSPAWKLRHLWPQHFQAPLSTKTFSSHPINHEKEMTKLRTQYTRHIPSYRYSKQRSTFRDPAVSAACSTPSVQSQRLLAMQDPHGKPA